jgi:LysR family transcriptional regulator, transcriptional activator of the cysJI operon
MLEIYELQVFLVAAETENFSEAGRILDISQPAVSAHIQALEQRLNAKLFERTGRNIKLNEVGEAFVPVVRNLLKEVQRAEEFIATRQGTLTGQLIFGCSTAAGKYVLPRVMARFMEQNPDVRLVCQMGPRGLALDRLSAGEIDLAISSLRLPRKEIEYHHFADDLLILIAPPDHPWAKLGSITVNDLVEYPIVLRESGSGTSITINRELARFDMSIDMLQTRLILWNTESIVHAVMEGIGPAFVSQMSTISAIQQHQAVEIPVENLHLIQRLYMARHSGFHATEAQIAFWDFTFAPENEDLRPILSEDVPL